MTKTTTQKIIDSTSYLIGYSDNPAKVISDICKTHQLTHDFICEFYSYITKEMFTLSYKLLPSLAEQYPELFDEELFLKAVSICEEENEDGPIFDFPGEDSDSNKTEEGIDVTRMIAAQMGLLDKYSTASAYIFLRFGSPRNKHGNSKKKILYTIFCNHGSGGGRKEGAKAIRLADMASVCDADIYIHSHTHLPMIMKQGYNRPFISSSSVSNCVRLFVNTASNLNYGGYGEAQEYKPNSKDTPTIYLNGSVKEMTAQL